MDTIVKETFEKYVEFEMTDSFNLNINELLSLNNLESDIIYNITNYMDSQQINEYKELVKNWCIAKNKEQEQIASDMHYSRQEQIACGNW